MPPSARPAPATLVVPLDGSRAAEEALTHAAALGRALRARVSLVRCLESAPADEEAVDTVSWRLRRAEAAAYLDRWASRLRDAGLEAATEVCDGKPADEIVAKSRAGGDEIVVLAAHGEGGASGADLGGTAQRVIARAYASFLLVPAEPGREPASLDRAYRRVVAAVDGSPRAEWALRTAAAVARAHGAELVVAHVVPVPEMPRRMPPTSEDETLSERVVARNREEGQAYLEEVRARYSDGAVSVRTALRSAPRVAPALVSIAREEAADLVVIAAHGGGAAGVPAGSPHGTVAGALIAAGTAPLLVLQDLPPPPGTTAPARTDRERLEPSMRE
jgi:nucleotide-binding universal stress UspA family protein